MEASNGERQRLVMYSIRYYTVADSQICLTTCASVTRLSKHSQLLHPSYNYNNTNFTSFLNNTRQHSPSTLLSSQKQRLKKTPPMQSQCYFPAPSLPPLENSFTTSYINFRTGGSACEGATSSTAVSCSGRTTGLSYSLSKNRELSSSSLSLS